MKPWLQRVTGFFPRNRLAGAEKYVCTQRLQSRSCSCVIVQEPLSYCLPSVSSQQFLCLATSLSNYLSDVCLSVQVSLLRLPLSVQPSVYAPVQPPFSLCPTIYLAVFWSIYQSCCLSSYFSVWPTIQLFVCPSIQPQGLYLRLISLCLF